MSKQKYRNYTDQDIINACQKVLSLAGLLRLLNLKEAGGNYINIKKHIQRLNIDTSHWTGQGWNKDEQLKEWGDYTKSSSLKKVLVKERGIKCESCFRIEWEDQPIPLELHHINGDRTDNQKQNLKLLCPNCHALTHNWRNRKQKAPLAQSDRATDF